jgi:glycosyltransferase involved in cell wall biosynthesis
MSLTQRGVDGNKITILPCSLGKSYEEQVLKIHRTIREFDHGLLRVLFIGRLDSYKRLDWLIDSLRIANVPWYLDVVGDGPRREYFEKYSKGDPVVFHGIINESEKLNLLRESNIFCLISDKCNEAFGIVQLEAMASGIPSLALNLRDSGMYWVSKTSSLPWSGSLADLPNALTTLYFSPALFKRCSEEARARYLQFFSSARWSEACFDLSSSLLSK